MTLADHLQDKMQCSAAEAKSAENHIVDFFRTLILIEEEFQNAQAPEQHESKAA